MKTKSLLSLLLFLLCSYRVLAVDLTLQGEQDVCQGLLRTYIYQSDHPKTYDYIIRVHGGVITEYREPDGTIVRNYNDDILVVFDVPVDATNNKLGYMTILWDSAPGTDCGIEMETQTEHDFWFPTTDNKSLDIRITSPPPPPTPILPASQITGNYNVCAGSAFTINFDKDPAATSTNWSTPTGAWLINGQGGLGINGSSAFNIGGGNAVRITVPAGTPTGQYEVHCDAMDACGRANGYRVIRINVGSAPYSEVTGPQEMGLSRYYYYQLSGIEGTGGTNIQWSVPDGLILSSGQGTFAVRVGGARTSGSGGIVATFTDQCGNLNSAVINVVWDGQYNLHDPETETISSAKAMYPNPAVNELTLSTGGEATQVMFYNNQGKLRKSLKLSQGTDQTRVSVQDLPEGFYHVHILRKGQAPVQQQLQIQR